MQAACDVLARGVHPRFAMMTTNEKTPTRTRLARITGILFDDGTLFKLPAGQQTEVVVEEEQIDTAPIEGDAAELAPAFVQVPEQAPRLARGSTPPPAGDRAVRAADVRRGGFKADISDARLRGRRVLSRLWQGEEVRVLVDRAHGGFIYDGRLWPSLSSIARRVCGHNRNGWEFFGLSPRGRK